MEPRPARGKCGQAPEAPALNRSGIAGQRRRADLVQVQRGRSLRACAPTDARGYVAEARGRNGVDARETDRESVVEIEGSR